MMPQATNVNNNSYSLEIDGNQCIQNVGDTATTANAWAWVDYKDGNTGSKINISLTAGTHTYVAYGREAGVKLDRIVFASETSCIPAAFGANCLPVDPATLTAPDLVITGITLNPASPTPNQDVMFSATIKNQGNAATPSGVIHGIGFVVNGTLVTWSDTYIQPLAAGQSVVLTSNGGPNANGGKWKPPTVGIYTITGTVDDINRIPGEKNETNNSFSTSVSVIAPTPTPTPPAPVTPAPSIPTDITPPVITQSFRNISTLAISGVINTIDVVEYQPTASDSSGIRTFTHKVNGISATLLNGVISSPKSNGDYMFASTAVDNVGLTTNVSKIIKLRYPDINRSGRVDMQDALVVLRKFNSTQPADLLANDFNGDGKITQYDLLYVLRNWR